MMNLFGRPTKAYKVVEVEKPRALPALDSAEVKAVMATLPDNPGFQYILARLRAQRAVIKATLESNRHESLKDVEWLQAGLFWAGWLEAETSRLTKRAAAIEADATNFEEDAFKQIDRMLERVGSQ